MKREKFHLLLLSTHILGKRSKFKKNKRAPNRQVAKMDLMVNKGMKEKWKL